MDPLTISFTVYGPPMFARRARARGRLIKVHGKSVAVAQVHDDPANVDEKTTIRALVMQVRPNRLMTGPLGYRVTSYFPIPASTSAKRKALMLAGKILPEVKPDYDNVEKIYTDAMEGIVFLNDKSICHATVDKFYGEIPRTEITIWELRL